VIATRVPLTTTRMLVSDAAMRRVTARRQCRGCGNEESHSSSSVQGMRENDLLIKRNNKN
jgi:hypothetical protein